MSVAGAAGRTWRPGPRMVLLQELAAGGPMPARALDRRCDLSSARVFSRALQLLLEAGEVVADPAGVLSLTGQGRRALRS